MAMQLSRTPDVIDGLRGPEHAAEAGRMMTYADIPEVQPGTRVFRSRFRKLRLHLGKRPDKWDNESGAKSPGFEFTALFDEYTLAIPAYFLKHAIPEDEQKEFLRRIDKHPSKGRDFDDVENIRNDFMEMEEAQVLRILESRPALKKKLAAELANAKGFQLPKPKAPRPGAGKQGVAPIPPSAANGEDAEMAEFLGKT